MCKQLSRVAKTAYTLVKAAYRAGDKGREGEDDDFMIVLFDIWQRLGDRSLVGLVMISSDTNSFIVCRLGKCTICDKFPTTLGD